MWSLDRTTAGNWGKAMNLVKHLSMAICSALVMAGAVVSPVEAGDYNGNFMARIGATVVHPDAEARVFLGGAPLPGADADVSTEVVPSLTLTYFFNKNLAVELFCCFAKHDVDGEGLLRGADLGDTWIFPPSLNLQYHFDGMGSIKPYLGAGVQYIAFFSEGRSPTLGGAQLSIDDAFGFSLQAGVDVAIGDGWYLNADVRKTWLDTDAAWAGTGVTADVDVDPWIFTIGAGYRFNLFN